MNLFKDHPSNDQDIYSTDVFAPTETSDFDTDFNYAYSEIGELIRDNKEDIAEIIWRVDSKISEIIRQPKSVGWIDYHPKIW
jgi:hypothetical protein